MEIILQLVKRKIRGKKVFWIICAAAVLAVFFLIVMAVDCNRFVIRKYSCTGKGLKKDVRVVLLSDLHNKTFGEKNKKLLEAVEGTEPDLILIAGDMYTCARGGEVQSARELVCALAGKYPVYYANGNHEHKTRLYPEEYGGMYSAFFQAVEKAGVSHLVNEKVYLPAINMDIYGLEIGREYFRKWKPLKMDPDYLEKLMGKPDPARFSLLLAHNPDYFETYGKWGADLVVSGHVHGGLMKLPFLGGVISPTLRLFPKYDGGKYQKDKTLMILSRGLGTHTLPIRIFNPGELVVIDIKRK